MDQRMSVPGIHPLAGQPAPVSLLVNVPKLVTAYYAERPDPSVREPRVACGTSGHRGSSLKVGCNEGHILDGPLFLGWDTHALSEPARASALEVLAACGVDRIPYEPGERYRDLSGEFGEPVYERIGAQAAIARAFCTGGPGPREGRTA
jgi:phosphoglucomutase